jgi:ABC-type nickel/cobalt efflux system permease component RcnA
VLAGKSWFSTGQQVRRRAFELGEYTIWTLLTAAGLIGFLHTLTGPDHFVPFIAMARVGGWSLRRTMLITLACGVGHVLGSIVLGALGITVGMALSRLEWFESARGELAGWLLLGFGLAYLIWGLVWAIRKRPHAHLHAHQNGTLHVHTHTHQDEHLHVHESSDRAGRMTPWILFAIFVFGPCEPLIPILMYPAATLSWVGVVAVALVFAGATLATMLVLVIGGYVGVRSLSLPWLERYSHALAGGAITACGAAIHFGL